MSAKTMTHRVETARTLAVGVTNSNPFPVEMQNELNLLLSVTAAAGTTPTLDVKYQVSPDGGTTWFDHGSAFAQQTGVANVILKIANNIGTFARLVYTVGGTVPSFTFDLWAVGKRTMG